MSLKLQIHARQLNIDHKMFYLTSYTMQSLKILVSVLKGEGLTSVSDFPSLLIKQPHTLALQWPHSPHR